jgi:hypothetical protein
MSRRFYIRENFFVELLLLPINDLKCCIKKAKIEKQPYRREPVASP